MTAPMGPGRRHPRREVPATGAAFACTADLAEGVDDELAVPTGDVRVGELLAAPGERLH